MIGHSSKHCGLVFCCFGGRKREVIAATLSNIIIRDLRTGDYQHNADFVVILYRTVLSVFGLQLSVGSCNQPRQSIDQIAELWPRWYRLRGQ